MSKEERERLTRRIVEGAKGRWAWLRGQEPNVLPAYLAGLLKALVERLPTDLQDVPWESWISTTEEGCLDEADWLIGMDGAVHHALAIAEERGLLPGLPEDPEVTS